jgi:hypothetical protein
VVLCTMLHDTLGGWLRPSILLQGRGYGASN